MNLALAQSRSKNAAAVSRGFPTRSRAPAIFRQSHPTPTIARCACGGSCPRCQTETPLQSALRATEPNDTRTFVLEGETGTIDPETGVETITSTCCPDHEGEMVSHPDKFAVTDAGARPDLGGTQAQYRFEYDGATDDLGPFCACSCCAFVQFVKGFFEVNGVRLTHTLPGSGAALSATAFGQDSPIIPHAGCRVATIGGALLSDTPGLGGIKSTDSLNVHLEFDARTIDTCNANNVVASRLFTLEITGAHPRTFSATGNFG